MREQWQPVAGGTPTLRVWSEGEREKQLTTVEKSLLEAAVATAARQHPEVAIQAKLAECTCREFTGYGAFLDLTVPDLARRTNHISSPVTGASINWRDNRRADLITVLFLKLGRIAMLELVPSDAQNWSVEDCRNLLLADRSSVVIKTEDS